MSNTTQTFRGKASQELPSTHEVYLITTSATPGTEASQALPDNTKQISIKVLGDDDATLKYTFTSGESGTDAITVYPCLVRTISDVNINGTIFFQVDQPSQVVEIEVWS